MYAPAEQTKKWKELSRSQKLHVRQIRCVVEDLLTHIENLENNYLENENDITAIKEMIPYLIIRAEEVSDFANDVQNMLDKFLSDKEG